MNLFGMEPSKTLNQSEAMARGIAIYGALERNFVQIDYHIPNRNLLNIMACWHQIYGDKFYGEDDTVYKNKQVLF